MILYDEALSLVLSAARKETLLKERVPLESSVGLRICEEVRSPEPHPSFDNSAMDGFAIRADESQVGAPLEVLDSIAAGDILRSAAPISASDEKRAGICLEIMTGAPLPGAFDSVVRVEDVEVLGTFEDGRPKKIRLTRAGTPGENVRRIGEDFQKDAVLCRAGTVIRPQHLLALGAAGAASVLVARRPRVAVISTGNELVEISEPLSPGKIRNSSAAFLLSSARESGAEVQYLGIVKDSEPDRLLELMRTLNADVVITTGAVSMGRHDFIPESVSRLGGERVFHKTAIRPGKPILFSTLGTGKRLAWFGLPGNPVSTAVGYRFFVLPYLRALAGFSPEVPGRALLRDSVRKPEGVRCFLLGKRTTENVEVFPAQASFKVGPLLEADCWVVLPETGTRVTAGEQVATYPFSARIEEGCS